jgi:beta-lactamase superfamily II metal-dependent hydrolase
MKMSRIWICILAASAVFVALPTRAADPTEKTVGFLEIIHIDVGQGDATLIISPSGKTMLVDGGDTGKGNRIVVPLLKARGIKKLDYVVATHYDADHIGGLDEVINHFRGRIEILHDRGRAGRKSVPGSKAYQQYVVAGKRKPGRDPVALGQGAIQLGGKVIVEIVAVGGCVLGRGARPVASKLDENSVSVAMVIRYGKFDYFIGGDLTGGGRSGNRRTPDIETEVANVVGDLDVLKLSHHGSETSSNEAFLSATSPEVAVVSVGNGGKNGRYHHPKRSVLDRLRDLRTAGVLKHLYATNKGETDGGLNNADSRFLKISNGHITVRSNGERYAVNNTWYDSSGPAYRSDPVSAGSAICGKQTEGAGNEHSS